MALLAATCSKIGPNEAAAAAAAASNGTEGLAQHEGIEVTTDPNTGQLILAGSQAAGLENWLQLGGGTAGVQTAAVQVPVIDSSGKQHSTIALNPQLLQQTPQVLYHTDKNYLTLQNYLEILDIFEIFSELIYHDGKS